MVPEIKLRLIAGISMVILFISIVLSNIDELTLVLLSLIQIKVFQELRQTSLTRSSVQLEKKQIISDWSLFFVFLSFSLHIIYSDYTKILIWYTMSYIQWFMLWIYFILDPNVNSNLSDHLLHTFWIHVIILYTTFQPLITFLNIRNGGIFWFLFPCSLIVCNDTAAYVCGKLFGKRKLLNISPNKTVEGFIGASIITVLFAYKFSIWLLQFSVITNDLYREVYDHIQLHSIVLGLFASIYAPFGGFFTSSIKRATNIKDFGQWIPGHGGLTDRVDCQLFLSVFTFVYFNYITT